MGNTQANWDIIHLLVLSISGYLFFMLGLKLLDGEASFSFNQLGLALCVSKLVLCGQLTVILTLGNLVVFVLLLS